MSKTEPTVDIRINGDFEVSVLDQFAKEIERRHQGQATAKAGTGLLYESFGQQLLTPEAISMGAFLVAFVSVLIQVTRYIGDKKAEHIWDADRLEKTIRSAMLRRNIPKCEIVNVDNFAALLDGKDEPCVLQVMEPTANTLFKVYVFRDGGSYVIELNR